MDDTPGGQVLRDGEAADLDYSHTTRVRCRSRAGSGLQRPFNSHQVSVWVSVRRRTAAPRRLQPSLNPHVSASRDAPERAKAELESERPARDRGFESPRFRSADQQERRSGAPPSAPPCWAGSQLVWVSVGPNSSPVPNRSGVCNEALGPLTSCTMRGRATSTACGAPGENFLYVFKPGRVGPDAPPLHPAMRSLPLRSASAPGGWRATWLARM